MSPPAGKHDRHPLRPPQGCRRALELAWERFRHQPPEQLVWLGAEPVGQGWRLPVLDNVFELDGEKAAIRLASGARVSDVWQVLALHYLAVAGRPEPQPLEITFADLATARGYAEVYHRRASARLASAFGQDSVRLWAAACELGGQAVRLADAAFDFLVFPRVCVRLVWYAGDEEFGASATWLLPRNIEAFFCPEDVVVLSERLGARLAGRPF